MKKFELTKEQLTYLHSVDSVKEIIEEWFPSEFQKLEYGKWYKCNFNNNRISLQVDKNTRYGFDFSGDWVNFDNAMADITKENSWTLATPKEVEEALTKEIKKRYPTDSRVKCLHNSSRCTVTNKSRVVYNKEHNYVCFAGAKVFDNGKFAEIVSEPIELTLDQIAEKFGVSVEQIKIVK